MTMNLFQWFGGKRLTEALIYQEATVCMAVMQYWLGHCIIESNCPLLTDVRSLYNTIKYQAIVCYHVGQLT